MSPKPSFNEAAERHSTSRTSDGTVLSSMMRAVQSAGIDAPAELYNEALLLAKDGHYGQSRARLHVLLGLQPADGDAHLLLGKIHVAGQQWRRALASLDEASQCGASVPDELRDLVIRNLQAEGFSDEDETARQLREQGELKKLKADVRRLRSENAHLTQTNRGLEKESARWIWVATATSLVSIALMGGTMLFSGGGSTSEVASVESTPRVSAAVAEAPVEAATPVTEGTPAPEAVPADPQSPSARNASAADNVKAALVAAGFPDVGVVVRGGRASLSGNVDTHEAYKAVLAAVGNVEGIEEVVADGLENVSRRKGSVHKVGPGESLSVIAYKRYGDQSLANQILEANPSLGGKPNLQVGQELKIPPVK